MFNILVISPHIKGVMIRVCFAGNLIVNSCYNDKARGGNWARGSSRFTFMHLFYTVCLVAGMVCF